MLILVKPPLGEYGGAVAVNESYSVVFNVQNRSNCGHNRDAGVYCYGKFS